MSERYTNTLDLPEPFLRAAERHAYSKGESRYSVTELIKPARAGALERLYNDAIVEDVADTIWSLLGGIGHGILEQAGAPSTGALLEERLFATVGGIVISGAMDHTLLLPTGCLDDYKFTATYQVMRAPKFEWIAQLNIYAYLRALHGQAITRLRIVAILRDWIMSRARAALLKPPVEGRIPYPSHQVAVVPIPLWTLEETEAYIASRIQAHLEADEWAKTYDVTKYQESDPTCTDEDRWVRERRWAFMKESRKTAVKLYDTEAEAQMAAMDVKGGYTEPRGGEPIRCMDWCKVGRAGLCSQWNLDKDKFVTRLDDVDASAFE